MKDSKPLTDLKPFTKCWAVFDDYPPWPAVICEEETTKKLRDFYSDQDGIGVLCLGEENEYALIEADKVFDYEENFENFKNGEGVQAGIEKMKGEIVMTQIEFVNDSDETQEEVKKSDKKSKAPQDSKKFTAEKIDNSVKRTKTEETVPEVTKPATEVSKTEVSAQGTTLETTVTPSAQESTLESTPAQESTAKSTPAKSTTVETTIQETSAYDSSTVATSAQSSAQDSVSSKTQEPTSSSPTQSEVKENTDNAQGTQTDVKTDEKTQEKSEEPLPVEEPKKDTDTLLNANLKHILATYPRETDLVDPTLKLLSDQVSPSKDVLKTIILVTTTDFESDPLNIKQKIQDMKHMKLMNNQTEDKQ